MYASLEERRTILSIWLLFANDTSYYRHEYGWLLVVRKGEGERRRLMCMGKRKRSWDVVGVLCIPVFFFNFTKNKARMICTSTNTKYICTRTRTHISVVHFKLNSISRCFHGYPIFPYIRVQEWSINDRVRWLVEFMLSLPFSVQLVVSDTFFPFILTQWTNTQRTMRGIVYLIYILRKYWYAVAQVEKRK